MTHVITRACCNDAACVAVCPTSCIHPTPDEPDFLTAEMLYIDPQGCIDCGACVEVCPVSAIQPDHRLGPGLGAYLDLNRRWFQDRPYERRGFVDVVPEPSTTAQLVVAVVGTGPAAMYAVEQLLPRLDDRAEVHLYERLPVPWGLVRHGVAPDHQDTKAVSRGFERLVDDPRVRLHLNIEVGRDVTHEQLRQHHHAVVYGVGAPEARPLAIPGADLTGAVSGTALVGWYNGLPGHEDAVPSSAFAGRRAVVVGNGNVALDVARVLLTGDRNLGTSDIAEHAVEALGGSTLDEVVLLGRRGPEHAAFTTPELLALLACPDLDVVVHHSTTRGTTSLHSSKLELLDTLPRDTEILARPGRRRIVLRFSAPPLEVVGSAEVEALRLATDPVDQIECTLLVSAVGYRGRAVPGLPFDDANGRIPHAGGRVLDGDSPLPGTYVVGWAKRGATGTIGTNKVCADETVTSLLEDAGAGLLPVPQRSPDDLTRAIPGRVDLDGWRRLDHREKDAGRQAGRPRVKAVRVDDMLALSRH